jgi:ATP/maltotriose-dependent transcriptional regulator MalT
MAQAGTEASRDLAARTDRIRAAMALSERQFPAAIEACRRVLAQPGLRRDTLAATKIVMGLAQAGSGKKQEAAAAADEAASLAAQSHNPKLMADAELARAETLLAAGNAAKALDSVLSAEEKFARIGRPDLEWRCWLTAARAKLSLHDAAAAHEFAVKASHQLAILAQKWDADNFKTYSSRPDVQYDQGQLARLVPAK